MRVGYNPRDYLYHGTNDLYYDIIRNHGIRIIKRPKGDVDFGPGFYVSVGLQQQAAKWALDKATNPTYNKEAFEIIGMTFRDFMSVKYNLKPVVLKYRINDPSRWKELKHKIFLEDNDGWRNWIFHWRKQQCTPEHDWVFGPVADGGLRQDAPHEIRSLRGFNQMSVHSQKAIEMLELLEVISC